MKFDSSRVVKLKSVNLKKVSFYVYLYLVYYFGQHIMISYRNFTLTIFSIHLLYTKHSHPLPCVGFMRFTMGDVPIKVSGSFHLPVEWELELWM